MPDISRYSQFVEHPRYGKGPRFTMLVPKGKVYLGWNTEGLIPKTAVKANTSKQQPATFHVTHYFDLERKCRDCGRHFLFFAAEQKHWYEELQFGLDSDCVRCVPCRKNSQGIDRTRRQFEELFHTEDRSSDQSLTMAECVLELIENNIFVQRQTERVRMLLNQLPERYNVERVTVVRHRMLKIEQAEKSCE